MSRALIVIRCDADRERAARWAMQAPVGTRVEFKETKRTLAQNALMWSRLTEIALKVEWYGQKLSPDDWKDVFSASLRKARVVPGIDPGTFVPLGMRTSDMSKEEIGNLLDLIDAFAAERGVAFNESGWRMTRRNFKTSVIVARFKHCGGRCETCGAVLKPGAYAVDHHNPDGLTGEPTFDNARCLCLPCHSEKTKDDVAAIAKAKRREAKAIGVPKPDKRPIPSPPKAEKERRFDRTTLPPRKLFEDVK